jgi:hypothetical protein
VARQCLGDKCQTMGRFHSMSSSMRVGSISETMAASPATRRRRRPILAGVTLRGET